MERLIKIKKNKTIKAGIGYTVGNYLLKGINFLTVPIFTRIMSTADYGSYSIYMTYDAIITVFIAFALHSSLKNAKYKYKSDFNKYLSSILVLPVISLVILLMILNVFPYVFVDVLGLNTFILNVLLCHSFANAIITIYNGKLSLDYQYKSFLGISFFNTIANIILSISLMFTLYVNNKCEGRIIGSALPMCIIAIYIYYRSFNVEKPRINLEYWKFGLGYSLPIIPHGISQIILSSFDRIMIKEMVGTAEAGIYSLGTNIEGLVKVTTTSLDTVWGPWFYEQMEKKDFSKIKQYSTYYIYGIFAFLSCLMMGAPEIVKIMGARSYQDAKYIVIPLLNCTFFTFLYTIPSTVEYYYQKTKMIAIGTMGAALINIILNYICISRLGYQVAAYTTLVSYIAYFIFHYFMAKKIMGFQLFNTKAIVFFSILSCVINLLAVALIEHFGWRLLIGVLFLSINVVYLLKRISPNFYKRS